MAPRARRGAQEAGLQPSPLRARTPPLLPRAEVLRNAALHLARRWKAARRARRRREKEARAREKEERRSARRAARAERAPPDPREQAVDRTLRAKAREIRRLDEEHAVKMAEIWREDAARREQEAAERAAKTARELAERVAANQRLQCQLDRLNDIETDAQYLISVINRRAGVVFQPSGEARALVAELVGRLPRVADAAAHVQEKVAALHAEMVVEFDEALAAHKARVAAHRHWSAPPEFDFTAPPRIPSPEIALAVRARVEVIEAVTHDLNALLTFSSNTATAQDWFDSGMRRLERLDDQLRLRLQCP